MLADELGELGIPVYLYGELGRRAHARGAAQAGRPRRASTPDFGPPKLHPTAGATLVAARPPLIAFNVEIDAPLDDGEGDRARSCARRSTSARSASQLHASGVQVSTNIEDHTRVTAADVVEAVRKHADGDRRRARRARARAPRSQNFPQDVPAARPGAARRSSTLVGAMAQTKRKRRTQAPRQRRGLDRGARPHRPQAHRGRAARRPRARPRATRACAKPPSGTAPR